MNHLEFVSFFVVALAIVFVGVIIMVFKQLAKNQNPIYNYDTKVKEVAKKTEPLHHEDGTLIGMSHSKKVYVADNAKHIFICGTTGSGKTVALSNYIKRAFDMGYPALIVDGKGDINEGSILEIVQKLGNRKTYIINLTDPKSSDKYNPFRSTTPTACKDMLISLTNWSEEHYKLNVERYLQRVVTLMVQMEIPLSFQSILTNIGVSSFLTLSKEAVKKELIAKEEHLSNTELASTAGKIAEGAVARFSLLAESELGGIFHEDGIDIATALKEKAVLLFILNPLVYAETSALMGRLILVDSKKAVGALFQERSRSFFIFDEMNTYASPALIDLVNKSRSAGVTCILASQSLSDLDYAVNDSFKEQVIENCNNYILLRQNSAKNAEAWANIIGTETKADTTYQLGNKEGRTAPTGRGSVKFNKQYIFHPDEIKNLKQGEAFYISKDNSTKIKIEVHKPF